MSDLVGACRVADRTRRQRRGSVRVSTCRLEGRFAGTWSLARPLLPLALSAIGPLASKTQAKTNSTARAAAFLYLKSRKKADRLPAGPPPSGTRRVGPARATVPGGEGGRPGRAAFAAGRGSLRSTSSQPTQRNGSHLRSRPHATTNVVCSSLPSPARHEALHASRLSTAVVHLICNQGVAGSNPVAGTNEINVRPGHIGNKTYL